ncbi:MAG: N-acetyl sugar amidotransferase [Hoeflea sp.]|uniref:N-acetyl sugar amidotransferase n=1 Tax=Hoeflea sp. TaxID=1940281 RepID=UPI0032994A1D
MTTPPKLRWCSKCVYPSSSALPLAFDDNGVCTGCRVSELRQKVDWDGRLKDLLELVEPYRKSTGYECVIGVSGGKDSYFQTHFVKEILGLRPLLVTYNGNNYLDTGWENLLRMKEVFNVDHYIASPSISMLVRMNRLGFRLTGDMNWHAHAGIQTLPMKMATQFGIKLVFYGEHGWTLMGGMLSHGDDPEFTARWRKDMALRGYDWYDFVGDEEDPVSEHELEMFRYPSDDEIEANGTRGIYIGNYDRWDANEHTKLVQERYGWKQSPVPFERTYRISSNLDDRYENGAHDYLKYVKFGYGRASDHACKDIRSGKMTREEGMEMVRRYDHVRSSDIDFWLNYVERSKHWFDEIADRFRSPRVWGRTESGEWVKENIWEQV